MLKKLGCYVQCYLKWVHTEEILMKLNMSLLIKNDELEEKYNEIWDKVTNSMKNGFDSEPVYNEKYIKTKMKSYQWKINTNFHGHKVPK